jgi:hypothetical protein
MYVYKSINFTLSLLYYQPRLSVLDKRRRIHLEVVLVRRWAIWILGIWKGRVWGGGGSRGSQFTSNLRPRWTDPVTARRVPSK